MEKRLIIAIILSVVILVTYQLLFMKPAQHPPAKTPETQTAEPAKTPEEKPAEGPEEQPAAAPAAEQPAAAPAANEPELPSTQVPRVEQKVETKLYDAVLDNRGGILKRFVLKQYHENHNGGVDLIPTTLPPKFGSFLSVYLPGHEKLAAELNGLIYEIRQTEVDTEQGKGIRVQFLYQRTGLQVTKELTFLLDQPYLVSLACRIVHQGTVLDKVFLRLGPGLTDHDLVPQSKYQIAPQVVTFHGNSADILVGGKINDSKAGSKTLTGSWTWGGIETKFFAALAIPPETFTEFRAQNEIWHYQKPGKADEKPVEANVVSLWVPIEPESPVKLYLGPKSYEILSSIREDLTKTIDYGWFAILVKPLYYALRWVNGFLNNWGWSIVLLTFFITLALFPIRYMQMKSMKDMGKIQPQMKAIQAKYKNQKSAEDRQRMNQEMMQLYKEAGVNPAASCLPMVAQIPFLIAFYNLIDKSIELWRQPFIFWIKDLSLNDPTYVTPILMGVTMILQMKQTPPTPGQDSRMQKQMMYIMPVVFTIFFLNMSAGLVVYFLFSNLFSWGLQKLVEIFMPGVQPVAAKKVKKKKVS
jgi:YidC/Oxa1 family membrane protein insertase